MKTLNLTHVVIAAAEEVANLPLISRFVAKHGDTLVSVSRADGTVVEVVVEGPSTVTDTVVRSVVTTISSLTSIRNVLKYADVVEAQVDGGLTSKGYTFTVSPRSFFYNEDVQSVRGVYQPTSDLWGCGLVPHVLVPYTNYIGVWG